LQKEFHTIQFDNISKVIGFKNNKSHLFAAVNILRNHADLPLEQKAVVAQKILEGGKKANIGWSFGGNWNVLQAAFSWVTLAQDAQNELKAAVKAGEKQPDPIFIASLEELANEALFVEPATALANQWKQILRDRMDSTVRIVVNKVAFKQEQTLNKHVQAKHNGELEEALAKVRWDFIQALGDIPIPEGSTGCVSRVQAPSTRNNSKICLYRSILTYFSIEQARTSTSYGSSYYGYNALNSGQISIKLWRAQALTLNICSVIYHHWRAHIRDPTSHPLHVAPF